MRLLVVLLAAGCLLAGGWLAGRASRQAPEPGRRFELAPVNPGGPPGLADLALAGERLRGRIVVWGLTPGSEHALVVRASAGGCPRSSFRGARPRPAGGGPQAALGSLTADPNGVGFLRVDADPGDAGLGADALVLVFAGRKAAGATVSCGASAAVTRLAPADLAAAGPGAGTRADVSGLVQVSGGRPVGGARNLRARPGDAVALALRADRPDELRLEGYGLTIQVGPGSAQRVSVRARRPGRHALRGRVAGGPVLAWLVVAP